VLRACSKHYKKTSLEYRLVAAHRFARHALPIKPRRKSIVKADTRDEGDFADFDALDVSDCVKRIVSKVTIAFALFLTHCDPRTVRAEN
jgi:hypothetical protein